MRRNWTLLGPAGLLLAVALVAAGLAWRDGGREPVHTIVEIVPLPGTAQ